MTLVLSENDAEEQETENDENKGEDDDRESDDDGDNTDNNSIVETAVGNEGCCKSKHNCENRTYFSIRDVENSIEKFCSDGSIKVEKWIDDFEETATMLRWSEQEKLIFGRRMLTSAAKQYIRAEKNIITWRKFKLKILTEFRSTTNTRDIHEELRRRRKKEDESCREYLYEMQAIGNQINLDITSLISYIIDGIDDTDINKLVLRGAVSMFDFKEKLNEYERMKKTANKNLCHTNQFKKRNEISKSEKLKPHFQKCEKPSRCFNCGAVGHEARNCPNKKDGPNFFICRASGHRAKDCQKKML